MCACLVHWLFPQLISPLCSPGQVLTAHLLASFGFHALSSWWPAALVLLRLAAPCVVAPSTPAAAQEDVLSGITLHVVVAECMLLLTAPSNQHWLHCVCCVRRLCVVLRCTAAVLEVLHCPGCVCCAKVFFIGNNIAQTKWQKLQHVCCCLPVCPHL